MRPVLASTLAALALPVGSCRDAPRSIRLATTKSEGSSGLLDALLPGFTEHPGIRVDAIAARSGLALKLAWRDHADVSLIADPELESSFIAERRALVYCRMMCDGAVARGPAALESMRVGITSLRAAASGSPAPFVGTAETVCSAGGGADDREATVEACCL